jgi:hypothetical protein
LKIIFFFGSKKLKNLVEKKKYNCIKNYKEFLQCYFNGGFGQEPYKTEVFFMKLSFKVHLNIFAFGAVKIIGSEKQRIFMKFSFLCHGSSTEVRRPHIYTSLLFMTSPLPCQASLSRLSIDKEPETLHRHEDVM